MLNWFPQKNIEVLLLEQLFGVHNVANSEAPQNSSSGTKKNCPETSFVSLQKLTPPSTPKCSQKIIYIIGDPIC